MDQVVVLPKELFDRMKQVILDARECCFSNAGYYGAQCVENFFSSDDNFFEEWGYHRRAETLAKVLEIPGSYQEVEI